MPPRLEKATLVVHVSASVGWLGAVAAFLALAIACLASADPQTVRAMAIAMDVAAWYVILPLALASLLTGVLQGLGTRWGLFRHYWVLAKLLITLVSTLLLLVHMQPISHLADAARAGPLDAGLRSTQVQMVADSAAAIVAMLAATVLSVLKPKGLTPYGWRRQRAERPARP